MNHVNHVVAWSSNPLPVQTNQLGPEDLLEGGRCHRVAYCPAVFGVVLTCYLCASIERTANET